MKILLLVATFAFISKGHSQMPRNFFMSKQWDKEISLYKAKAFVINEVLETSNDVIKFQVSPISASKSGELTTLIYDCKQQNKSGLVMVFYGDYWNDAGVLYTGYTFKQFEKGKANLILKKLSKILNDNYKFLNENKDDFNVVYEEDDMTFLIYNVSINSTKIRVFWNGLDSEWDAKSLYKTLEYLEKK
ncbi:MAG: hypothetical protein JST62_09525 [Bacteroidetes bacterium]|nr:hypothetical protein [Bacteroidota bacterium]